MQSKEDKVLFIPLPKTVTSRVQGKSQLMNDPEYFGGFPDSEDLAELTLEALPRTFLSIKNLAKFIRRQYMKGRSVEEIRRGLLGNDGPVR